MRRLSSLTAVLIGVMWGAACSVSQTKAPDLTGPSEFATSISVTATPDTINWDGASKSAVAISAHSATGQPLAGLTVRVDMAVGGTAQDFGTLSARTLVTGSDGRATVVYTAPPAPPPPAAGTISRVTIVASPFGSNAQNTLAANLSSADIRLVPTGVILPPAGTPTAAFTVSPTPVTQNLESIFDASASTPGPNATQIVSFAWSFGDGDTAVGVKAHHSYTELGTFTATLTVMNDRGVSASVSQTISVGTSSPPSAAFSFSPTDNPLPGATVFFNAAASTAAPGRHIDSFTWDFGDGSPLASGVQTSHSWSTPGTYTVTLTVQDDAEQKSTVTKTIGVGTGNPTASFTMSPAPPVAPGTTINFDGSASTAATGSTIATYTWTFGDGTGAGPSSSAATSHAYGATGTFTVTLTVTDSAGRSGTSIQVVKIQ